MGSRRLSESLDERTLPPAGHRRARHHVGRRGRVDRHERWALCQLWPAPPRDRPDLPVRRVGDLGSRADQSDRPVDDLGRADVVHRDAQSGRPADHPRTCARARGHAHRHPAGADPGLSEWEARDDRRPRRRRDPRHRRDRAQRPLLDEPSAARRQEQRPVRGPGARHIHGRCRRPALAHRAPTVAARTGTGPRRRDRLPRAA